MPAAFAGCEHVGLDRDRPSLIGVEVDPVNEAKLHAAVRAFLECGRAHVVHFLPADPIVRAGRDADYRWVLNRGSLNVPDGRSVAWALRLHGARSDRIAGADAMRALTRGPQRQYLLGGAPHVLFRLRHRLERDGAKVVGGASPPFRTLGDEELRAFAARARDARAELLWLGLGTPRQDMVAERLRELEAAPVILCVGAAFDFLSGAKRRAPLWMQRSGLEWTHRLASEPGRLWRRYLLGNPAFVWGIARELIGGRRRR